MPVSFFCKTTAANVWKSVTGVSAAGSKRGRGKGLGRAIVKDFNRGQQIGVGRKRLVLPGLNSPVLSAQKYTGVQDVGVTEEFDQNLAKARKEMDKFRKYREAPLDRGWSGRRVPGRRAGQPDDHNDTPFEGFDSIVLMLRSLHRMTGVLGRVKKMQALVVTGNKNGLVGFDTATGSEGKAVVRHARNKAAQNLVYIPRWDNHTVLHDFYSRYYFTTVFVQRKPKGYGIRAHRAIKAICEMVGITDLYAKVEGKTSNKINLTKAFFLGLMNQKQYQDMADEKKLHLVEINDYDHGYPRVLATPREKVLSEDEIRNKGENLDFTYYIYDGRIKTVKSKRRNPHEGDATWYRHLGRLDYTKNREKTKLLLAAKYGDTRVKDVFPYFRTTAESFKKDVIAE